MKKVFIITGAANGIGNQIAKDLDSKNHVLCLFDNDKKLLNINKCLNKAECFLKVGDVTCEKSVFSFISEIVKKYGKIDVLVNNAGIVPYSEICATESDMFLKVLKTNLGGYFLFSREVSKIMKIQKLGHIVNISSISSIQGIPGQTAYASTKGAINSLTRVLAKELGPYNIRVNAIAPGSIIVDRNESKMLAKWKDKSKISKFVPLGRLGTPKDISGVVKFLISKDASFVHGTVIIVDGGKTINGN